jgi:hypothetical protein
MVHAADDTGAERAMADILAAFTLGDAAPAATRPVLESIMEA